MVKKILLYLSAFVPLYLLLLIKIVVQIINKNLTLNVLNGILITLFCILTILGITGLATSIGSGKKVNILVVSATNLTEKHFLGYFSLFVLFALGYQIELFCMAIVFALILIFIGVVYVRNNLFYINPLLNILGFSFYSVSYRIDGTGESKTDTMFYFGKLCPNLTYVAYINECNFNYIK